MYDVIVIGAGTAGMSAALNIRRAGKSVLMLEGNSIGGQIAFSPRVENFPSIKEISGNEFSNNLFEQVTDLGAEFEFEKVIKIIDNGNSKTVVTEETQRECKAIIIATGVKNRELGLENEHEFIGNGVSYCAICDGVFFKDKIVGVVGGGNTALQDALYLCAFCKKVYIIHRRNDFRGDEKFVETLKTKNNVEFILNKLVSSLIGTKELEKIHVCDVATNEESTIEIDGLFIAIGQIPQNECFEQNVKMDEQGFILTDENCKTSVAGIFAAGDCRAKQLRQLITAASDGAVCAEEIIKILH